MARVKFTNKVKYNGVWYDAHSSFTVDDKDVEALVSKGAIVTEPCKAPEGPKGSVKSIDNMKVDELKAYAAEHNIDIDGVEKKADILAAIKAAESSEE